MGLPDAVDARSRLADAISALDDALVANVTRNDLIRERLHVLASGIEAGQPVKQLLDDEPEPRLVELLTANLEALNSAGADLRATEARALRSEGLTIEAIAQRFGVTRQRISALLRQRQRS